MLQIDVSTPQWGEATVMPGGATMIADEKTVAVTLSDGEEAASAFQLPAESVIDLCGLLYQAARKADPSLTIMDLMGAVVKARP